ncbi:MAG TPA: GDP-mannose 4,6-dehydratase [Acidimicrobiales bacterium]|nr:GDP-mannose 4,6-dehydratase [Acidimicrobiales bacterium]
MLDRSVLDEAFDGVDAVVHLAARPSVPRSIIDPTTSHEVNATGTIEVLEAVRRHAIRYVIVASSSSVYGANPVLPKREDLVPMPVSPYAASKAAADALAQQAWLGHRLPVIRVRAFNHLGPGQTDRFLAPSLAARIARNERDGGEEVPIGNMTPRRDVTDVRDVVRAYRLLVERGEPGEAYNVCTGRAVAVKEIADLLLGMARRPMRLVSDPALERPVDIPVLVGDNTRLARATGWSPTIPLERTLADVLADWRSRLGG